MAPPPLGFPDSLLPSLLLSCLSTFVICDARCLRTGTSTPLFITYLLCLRFVQPSWSLSPWEFISLPLFYFTRPFARFCRGFSYQTSHSLSEFFGYDLDFQEANRPQEPFVPQRPRIGPGFPEPIKSRRAITCKSDLRHQKLKGAELRQTLALLQLTKQLQPSIEEEYNHKRAKLPKGPNRLYAYGGETDGAPELFSRYPNTICELPPNPPPKASLIHTLRYLPELWHAFEEDRQRQRSYLSLEPGYHRSQIALKKQAAADKAAAEAKAAAVKGAIEHICVCMHVCLDVSLPPLSSPPRMSDSPGVSVAPDNDNEWGAADDDD
eukprot:GHVU01209248.1.p1 GENE.GHVU01209248.1~~GHVU01209248.1.p1  ORF type:complete len:323 (+),score=30.04 GHVU01209248.1:750-1718(+)